MNYLYFYSTCKVHLLIPRVCSRLCTAYFLRIVRNGVSVTLHTLLWTVLGIRISFNADPDPAFNLNKEPDPWSQTNADQDLDPGQTFTSPEKYTLCTRR